MFPAASATKHRVQCPSPSVKQTWNEGIHHGRTRPYTSFKTIHDIAVTQCSWQALPAYWDAIAWDWDNCRAKNHARQWQWPTLPSDYIPNNSPGWQSILERRFEQTAWIADSNSKYKGYMSTVHSALLVPNFTEFWWGLSRALPDLVEELMENTMLEVSKPPKQ